ncbi:MAG: hypothetical protein MZV70_12410 [Desulfobacterales bacterium]|nr:hypothetical protein [Desulfobacterales bacterium]
MPVTASRATVTDGAPEQLRHHDQETADGTAYPTAAGPGAIAGAPIFDCRFRKQ